MDRDSLLIAAGIAGSAISLAVLALAVFVVRRRRRLARAAAMSIPTVDLSTRAGFAFAAAAPPQVAVPFAEADAEWDAEAAETDAEAAGAEGADAHAAGDLAAAGAGADAEANARLAAAAPIAPEPANAPEADAADEAADRDPHRIAEPIGSERLLGRATWAEAFAVEERRVARYGRPATIVLAELDGFEALSMRLGDAAAERMVGPMSAVLAGQARESDLVARIDRARFVVLMPETDEVEATNYVERVRDLSEPWLAAAAVSVRLAVGWASSPTGGTLAAAMMTAEQRMNAARRVGRGRKS